MEFFNPTLLLPYPCRNQYYSIFYYRNHILARDGLLKPTHFFFCPCRHQYIYQPAMDFFNQTHFYFHQYIYQPVVFQALMFLGVSKQIYSQSKTIISSPEPPTSRKINVNINNKGGGGSFLHVSFFLIFFFSFPLTTFSPKKTCFSSPRL